jgi:hypothetical protein
MYGKNKIAPPHKFSNAKKADEIVQDFINELKVKKENNSVLNSTAYSNCLGSIRSISDLNVTHDDLNFSDYLKLKEKPLKDKFNHYAETIDPVKNNRIKKIENQRNKNVNIFDFRYSDIDRNQSVINFLPRFKLINEYNKRAASFYKSNKMPGYDKENLDFECSKCREENLKGRVSKVNVLNKINEYKNYIKYCEQNSLPRK